MQINEIVAALNQEISRLEQVRDLLANSATGEQTGKRRGRPKGSVNKVVAAALRDKDATSPKRQMSAEGRARIAEAQRKRWAVSKQTGKSASRQLAKRSSAKKSAKQRRGELKSAVSEAAATA